MRPMGDLQDWFAVSEDVAKHAARELPGLRLKHSKGKIVGYALHRTAIPALPLDLEFPLYSASPPLIAPTSFALRPYQIEPAQFVRERRGTILAMRQRSGKTSVACAAHEPSTGALFVVGPLITASVWETWFRRAFPTARIYIAKGMDIDIEAMSAADCIFIHYDIVQHWKSLGFFEIGTMVLDEGHVLSNYQSSRTKACAIIATQAHRVVVLTGTPLWNKLRHLYSILSIVVPGAFGSFTQFAVRYCDGKQGPYGLLADGTSNEAELKLRLSEVLYKLDWSDIGVTTQVHRHLERVKLSVPQTAMVTQALESVRTSDTITKIGDIARSRRLLGAFKLPAAVDLVLKLWSSGCRNPIVWVWHQDLLKQLGKMLPGSYVVGQHVATKRRDEILEEWRRDGSKPLVISIGIGQAGIDLSATNTAIFAEMDWTPAVLSQAEMRPFVPGGDDVQTYYLVTSHPADVAVSQRLLAKVAIASAVGVPAADLAFGAFLEEKVDNADAIIADWLGRILEDTDDFTW